MIFGKKILPTPKMNVFVCICCHSFGIQRGTSPCDYFGPSKQKIWGWNDCCTIGGANPRLGMMEWRRRISPPSWWFESMGLARHVGKKSTHRLTSSTYHLGPVDEHFDDNLFIFSKGHLFIFTFQFFGWDDTPNIPECRNEEDVLGWKGCGWLLIMSVNVCPTSLHSPSDDRIHGWSMMLFAKDTWKKRQSDLFWDRCKKARAFCVLNLNMFNAAGNSGNSVFACAHCWLKCRSAQPAQLTSGQITAQFWQLQVEKTSFSEFV